MSNKYKKIYEYCTTLGFTISCKSLENKFLRDKNIRRSYFLFSFIFSYQKFHDKDWVELSLSYISKSLNCSISTTVRHILNLENNGYLITHKNYSQRGFNKKNSYSVTLPLEIEKELNNEQKNSVHKSVDNLLISC